MFEEKATSFQTYTKGVKLFYCNFMVKLVKLFKAIVVEWSGRKLKHISIFYKWYSRFCQKLN